MYDRLNDLPNVDPALFAVPSLDQPLSAPRSTHPPRFLLRHRKRKERAEALSQRLDPRSI